MSDKKTTDKNEKNARLDTALVRELAAILRDTDLTEIEVEQGGMRLRLARGGVAAAPVYAPAPVVHQVSEPLPPPAPFPSATTSRNGAAPAGAVTSPMVGTAYLSPEPGSPPFIKVGDSVTEGQTMLVVEAMKTFNPIPAPRAGKVSAILVIDAQPVEFGEALVVLE